MTTLSDTFSRNIPAGDVGIFSETVGKATGTPHFSC